jgi:hypothetical protein
LRDESFDQPLQMVPDLVFELAIIRLSAQEAAQLRREMRAPETLEVSA